MSAFVRLAQALAALKQPAAIEKLLLEIMTPGEVHDLGLRWELVELLVEGVSQRQIASRLGISLCKITRGAKILKKKNGAVAGVFAQKAPAAQAAKSAVKNAAAKPAAKATPAPAKKPAAKPAEMADPAKKAAAKKAAPAKKPARKVEEKHGTRVARKSKNQVRR